MTRINLLDGLWIDNFRSHEEATNFIVDKLLDNTSHFITFLYFSSFVLQRRLHSYHKAIVNSDHILPDGIGMALYTKLVFGTQQVLNLNGTDLLPRVLSELNRRHHGTCIALYGSTNQIIQRAFRLLNEKYSKLNFYYFSDGYQQLAFSKLKKGSTLLVGLGTPKQECFVFQNMDLFQKKNITVITVGGLFDFISGNARRAPDWVKNTKLEWAYRLLQDPQMHIKKNIRNLFFLNIVIHDYFLSKNL